MLHDPIARHFKQCVCKREQCDSECIAICIHVSLLQQVIACLRVQDSSIADIASIKKIQKVHPTKDWQDADVETTIECAVSFCIVDICSDGFVCKVEYFILLMPSVEGLMQDH